MNDRMHIAAVAAALSLSTVALGTVVNGGFESGGTGWSQTSVLPSAQWSITFPPTGGVPGGHAEIMSPFGDSEGEVCLLQVFECGNETDTIRINVDLRCTQVDANSEAGRARVYLDNELVFERTGEPGATWISIGIPAPGGFHSIGLCLDVDAGNNGYRAEFDDVIANVEIPNPPGACCIDGGCLELDFESCTSVQGTYQGNNTECATVSCPARCPGDTDDSREIDFADLLNVLSGWGLCP